MEIGEEEVVLGAVVISALMAGIFYGGKITKFNFAEVLNIRA
jgi:hypothetical protein